MKAPPLINSSQSRTQAASFLRSTLEAPLQLDDPLTSPLIGNGPLVRMRTNPNSAIKLAHGKLHSYYPFSEVPVCWRRCFEEACLWQVLTLFQSNCVSVAKERRDDGCPCSEDRSELDFDGEIIKLCDDVIIIAGAPGRRSLIDEILRVLDEGSEKFLLGSDTQDYDEATEDTTSNMEAAEWKDDDKPCCLDVRPAKRPRRSLGRPDSLIRSLNPSVDSIEVPSNFPVNSTSHTHLYEHQLTRQIARRSAPSLAEFERHLKSPEMMPLVVTDALGHWPALTRWRDPRYWLYRTHRGRRRVPVEWGRSYVDEGWGQSIIPFGEFLHDVLLETDNRTDEPSAGLHNPMELQKKDTKKKRKNGYLAQHDILGQIPALRNDIAIPDYCYCSTESSVQEQGQESDGESIDDDDVAMINPALNIWLGPAGTVSPAHTDPHHNLLAQVFGKKYVRLFSPAMEQHLYPMSNSASSDQSDPTHGTDDKGGADEGGYSMSNTSSVDVGLEIEMFSASSPTGPMPESPGSCSDERRLLQRSRFPTFHTSAEYVECILEPGEMLFIPRGWWHYVRSVEVSCNVSFWWD